MRKLRLVEAWPSVRDPARSWQSDDDLAAFLGSSRGIFDLYSEELIAAEQPAKAYFIRFFIADEVRAGLRGLGP